MYYALIPYFILFFSIGLVRIIFPQKFNKKSNNPTDIPAERIVGIVICSIFIILFAIFTFMLSNAGYSFKFDLFEFITYSSYMASALVLGLTIGLIVHIKKNSLRFTALKITLTCIIGIMLFITLIYSGVTDWEYKYFEWRKFVEVISYIAAVVAIILTTAIAIRINTYSFKYTRVKVAVTLIIGYGLAVGLFIFGSNITPTGYVSGDYSHKTCSDCGEPADGGIFTPTEECYCKECFTRNKKAFDEYVDKSKENEGKLKCKLCDKYFERTSLDGSNIALDGYCIDCEASLIGFDNAWGN